MDEDQIKWALEVCTDAENHRLTTEWERSFASNVGDRVSNGFDLSQKQIDTLKEIERKIYQ